MGDKNLSELVSHARTASEMLKGLSHETRLLTVCFIGKGEKNVQELEDYLGTTQANISQHLAKLRALGILENRKEGNQVFYRIKNPDILKLVQVLQNMYC